MWLPHVLITCCNNWFNDTWMIFIRQKFLPWFAALFRYSQRIDHSSLKLQSAWQGEWPIIGDALLQDYNPLCSRVSLKHWNQYCAGFQAMADVNLWGGFQKSIFTVLELRVYCIPLKHHLQPVVPRWKNLDHRWENQSTQAPMDEPTWIWKQSCLKQGTKMATTYSCNMVVNSSSYIILSRLSLPLPPPINPDKHSSVLPLHPGMDSL